MLPITDDRDPAAMITGMVQHVLALAATWTAWDGRPMPIDDRIYTPHKAIRRVADHLVDHLAELEARLAGEPPLPDRWHASTITTRADLAPFTQVDRRRGAQPTRPTRPDLGEPAGRAVTRPTRPLARRTDGPSASSPSTSRVRSTTPTPSVTSPRTETTS